ncbi:hypothetical protein FQN49_000363 [Arthroderma sp. PD_2]|nr:hypothetical protein FQN49_000363 [Arthroderma sp. PD_2]
MARPSSPNANYPEINENFKDFEYKRLAAPPKDWELYDIPDKTHLRNRAFDLKTFKKLVNHHAWGFNVIIGERKTKENLLQVLKRVIYNHDARLRPNWHEFVSRNCDAGPRLLRPSYNPPQFSRRMPRGVPGWKYALPPEAPSQYPVAQADPYSSQERPPPDNASSVAEEPLWPTPPRDHRVATRRPATNPYLSHQHHMGGYNPASSSSNQSSRRSEVSQAHKPGRTRVQEPAAYSPELRPPEDRHRHAGDIPIPSQYPLNCLFRKAVSRRAYGLLDKASFNAAPPAPIDFSTALEAGSIIGATTLSHLRLLISEDLTRFAFDSRGVLYPFRGRGPLSRDGISDIVDCVIVAGLLTDAGSTTIDKKAYRKWTFRLNVVEKAFIKAMNDCSNDVSSDEQVMTVKENLWNTYIQHRNLGSAPTNRLNIDPALIWTDFTKHFAQFQLEYTDKYDACNCGAIHRSVSQRSVVAHSDHGRGDIRLGVSSLLRRFFQNVTSVDCPECKAVSSINRERVFESTPLRLVVRPDVRSKIRNQYKGPIKVKFTNTNDEVVNEEYAFIGGIYSSMENGHPQYRICWGDNGHDTDAKWGRFTRLYDARQISGMIAGGIVPQEPLHLSPNSWWLYGRPELLFFEKIIQPPKELSGVYDEVDNSSDESASPTPSAKDGAYVFKKRSLSGARQPVMAPHTTPKVTKPPAPPRRPAHQEPRKFACRSTIVNTNSHQSVPYISTKPRQLSNSQIDTNQVPRRPQIPTITRPTNHRQPIDYRSKPELSRNHQADTYEEVHSPAPLPTFTKTTNHRRPTEHRWKSASARNHQVDTPRETHSPVPTPAFDTPINPSHPVSYRPMSVPINNPQVDTYQTIQSPQPKSNFGTPTNPRYTTEHRPKSVPTSNIQANTYEDIHNPLPMSTVNAPTSPQYPMDAEFNPAPTMPSDSQVMQAVDAEASTDLLAGVDPQALEAAGWEFDEFFRADDTNDVEDASFQQVADTNPATLPPDNSLLNAGTQSQGVSGSALENIDFTDPMISGVADLPSDDAWFSQWDVDTLPSQFDGGHLAGTTFPEAPLAGDAAGGNALKRKSLGGNGDLAQSSDPYGAPEWKRRG